jgi:hypothetical protein
MSMSANVRVALCVFAFAAIAAVSLIFLRPSVQPVTAAYEIEHDSLSISVSTVGRFGRGYSWHLHVASDGAALLTIDSFPKKTQRRFNVSKAQFVALRCTLLAERFFDLGDEYGEQVPDGSTTTISISAGDRTKTVKLRFLMNWVHHDNWRLREPRRAVKVLLLIRDWFEDPAAVDLRRYDRMVLEH